MSINAHKPVSNKTAFYIASFVVLVLLVLVQIINIQNDRGFSWKDVMLLAGLILMLNIGRASIDMLKLLQRVNAEPEEVLKALLSPFFIMIGGLITYVTLPVGDTGGASVQFFLGLIALVVSLAYWCNLDRKYNTIRSS